MSYVLFPLKPSPLPDPIFISGSCLLCLGPDGDGCVTGWWEVMGINSLLNLSHPLHHHHCHHHQLLIHRACSWIKEVDKEWESDIFLSWHAAKSFNKYLTMESFIPTSMLSIKKWTMWLGVTLNVSEVPIVRVDTATWRHLPRHLVWFSHAFPLDSFSHTARTRSHVQCWQLSSLGINLEFRYLQVMLIGNIRFIIPTP